MSASNVRRQQQHKTWWFLLEFIVAKATQPPLTLSMLDNLGTVHIIDDVQKFPKRLKMA